MIGVIVNALAVIIGSVLGILFRKSLSKRINSAVMVGIGLCVIYIGIDGMLGKANIIVAIVSMVLGTALGTLLDIDGALNRLGDTISLKVNKKGKNSNFTQGFVAASLLFCVGAMAITGSISAGLTGDNSTLYAKSLLDLTAAIMLASSFGIGVAFSTIPLFLYQGSIALFSSFLEPLLTKGAIDAITCVGSIIIMGLGFNLTKISNFKIADYIPAIIFSPFIYYIFEFLI